MKDLDVNTAIGSIFMSVTLRAAVHFWKEYTETQQIFGQLLQVTDILIKDQTEITGLTTIYWQQPMWRETTLKTYVFSDSVLCLGGISDEQVKVWESRIKCFFLETHCFSIFA